MVANSKLDTTNSAKTEQWISREAVTGRLISTKLSEIAADPEKSKQFLIKAGFITKAGNLTSRYK